MNKIRKISLIIMALYLYIDELFRKSNKFNLFMEVYVIKKRKITNEIAMDEFYCSNLYRWKKSIDNMIIIIEERIIFIIDIIRKF